MRSFDTSALVKQYLQEAGFEDRFRTFENRREGFHREPHLCRDACGIQPATREGRLTRQTTRRLALRFDKDWESYDIVILSENVLSLARRLLYRHPLRSADALHLASALLLARTSSTARWAFVCADGRLCDAAEAEGFNRIFTAADSVK